MALIFNEANKPLMTRVGEATRLWLSIKPHDVISLGDGEVEIITRKGTIDVETATAKDFGDWLDHAIDSNAYKAEAIRSFIRRCFLIRFPTEFNASQLNGGVH